MVDIFFQWIQNTLSDITFVIIYVVIGITAGLIVNLNESERFKKLIKKKSWETRIKKIKNFLFGIVTIFFFLTLLTLVSSYILKQEIFTKIIPRLVVVALTLGAFSIAMATIKSQAKKNPVDEDLIKYVLIAESFVDVDQNKLKEFVRNHPYIVRCVKTFGKFDLLMYLNTENSSDFHKTIKSIKKNFSKIVKSYDTWVVYREHCFKNFPDKINYSDIR